MLVTAMSIKQRLVPVYDEELAKLLTYGPDDLGAPTMYKSGSEWLVDADELRAWRSSQNTLKGGDAYHLTPLRT